MLSMPSLISKKKFGGRGTAARKVSFHWHVFWMVSEMGLFGKMNH